MLNKSGSKILIVFLIFAIILSLVIISFHNKCVDLNESLNELKTSLSKTDNQLKLTERELRLSNSERTSLKEKLEALNQTNLKLSEDLSSMNQKYSSLGNSYFSLKAETEKLLDEINDYKHDIEKSLQWYQYNSHLDSSEPQSETKLQITNNCYRIKGDSCIIKLGCFGLINEKKLHLSYKTDESLYKKKDKISSLADFLKNKGGDCEDYSLFFKAEYNYAKDECSGKKIILETWEPSDNGGTHWLTFGKNWYLKDAEQINIENFTFPNIICGNIYDSRTNSVKGHCMIALTNHKIENIRDLRYLFGAYVIEPQDGSYKGRIDNYKFHLFTDGFSGRVDNETSWIDSVITDNDFYLYSFRRLRWNSYSSFLGMLDNKGLAIEQSMGND